MCGHTSDFGVCDGESLLKDCVDDGAGELLSRVGVWAVSESDLDLVNSYFVM